MTNHYSIEEVEKRLEEWAKWHCKGKEEKGRGYPKESTLYHIMTKGIIPFDHAYPKYLPTNEAAEEIDMLIAEMSQHEEEMAKVLVQYYLYPKPTFELTARAIGLAGTKFKTQLRMAKAWIAGSLSLLRKKAASPDKKYFLKTYKNSNMILD